MIQSVLDTFKTEGSDDQFYQKKKRKEREPYICQSG